MNPQELIGKAQNIAIDLGMEAASVKPRAFVVTLKNLAPFISRVSYEKSDKDIKLYFTLLEALLKEDLSGIKLLATERTPETLLLELITRNMGYNQGKKLCSFALSRKDFQETNGSVKLIPGVMERLRSLSRPGFSYEVTFEESGAKKGLLWTENPALIQEYTQAYGGIRKGNWLLWNA